MNIDLLNMEPAKPEDYIQIVIVEPNKKPFKTTVANTTEAFHNIVGGNIENIFIGFTKTKDHALGVVINEDHLQNDLPFNRRILSAGIEIITGTFIVTAYDAIGENVSLTNEEAERQIRRFSSYEVYI